MDATCSIKKAHFLLLLCLSPCFSDPHSTQFYPNDGSLPLFSASELAPTYHDGGIRQCLGCPHYARSCKEPLYYLENALFASQLIIHVCISKMQASFVIQHRGGCTRVGSAASKHARWQPTTRTRRWTDTRSEKYSA